MTAEERAEVQAAIARLSALLRSDEERAPPPEPRTTLTQNGYARQMRINAEVTKDWPHWMKAEASARFGTGSLFDERTR